MEPRTRRWAWLGVRLAVSAGALAVVLANVPLDDAVAAAATAAPALLLVSLAAKLLAVPCSALAWHAFLDPQEGVRRRSAVVTYFASQPATLLAPGNLGGDAYRVAATAGLRRAPEGVASLLGERALVLLAMLGAAAAGAWLSPIAAPWRIPMALLAASAAAGLIAGAVVGEPLARRVPGPGAWARGLNALLRGLGRLRAPARAAEALGGASGMALLQALSVVAVFAALGWALDPAFALFAGSAAALVVFVPITVQGVGVREGAFLALFHGVAGVPAPVVLAASLLTWTLSVCAALLGGVALWWPRRAESAGIQTSARD